MKKISAKELSNMPTFIKEFMVDKSSSLKTFEQLADIFVNCHKGYSPDRSNDLRSIKFSEGMKNKEWKDPVVFTLENGQVTDGIHRGVAYLLCIREGVKESDLPELFIIEV